MTESPEATEPPRSDRSGLFETATDQDALDRAAAAAAATSAERADLALVHSLDASLHAPMFALLSSLADNKYMLGRRYAEWCTGAPMLESAVAAAAMAQDELGHARSFYPMLRSFPGGRDAPPMEEKGWQQRPTSAMRCLDQPFRGWSEFVAANFVVDTALTVLLIAANDSPYEPLRQRARKIEQEEDGHWVHAVGWMHRLGTHLDLLEALANLWDDAFTWYGQADDPILGPLVEARILTASPDALRRDLKTRLAPILEEANGTGELLDRPLPWSRWDSSRRRLRD